MCAGLFSFVARMGRIDCRLPGRESGPPICAPASDDFITALATVSIQEGGIGGSGGLSREDSRAMEVSLAGGADRLGMFGAEAIWRR